MIKRYIIVGLVSLLILFPNCVGKHNSPVNIDNQPNIYPDYCGVTVPSNIAPLNFCMEDEEYTSMEVNVRGEGRNGM